MARVSDRQYAESKHQYRDPRTGERLMGVTSIVRAFDPTGDKLGAGAGAAVKLLRDGQDYRKVWNEAADLGKRVHGYAGLWAQGKPADVPADEAPYMDAFEKFCIEHEPTFIETERAVVSHFGYGGKFDFVAEFRAGPLADSYPLVDIKTGKHYQTELTLQLTGYRYADGMVLYDDLGWARMLEPMPHIDHAAGLYLHDDGTYDLAWVNADDVAFRHFVNLLETKRWAKSI